MNKEVKGGRKKRKNEGKLRVSIFDNIIESTYDY